MTHSRLLTSLAGAAVAGLLLTGCGGLSDDDRDQAGDAALQAVGGDGRVTEVEEADGDETAAYNVEVSLDSGESIDVELDDDFGVLNQAEIDNELAQLQSQSGGTDDGLTTESPSPSPSASASDPGVPAQVDDDTPLEGQIKQQAEQAALAEVGQGRVTESTYADADEDHAYEVEIERGSGDDDDVTVDLAEDFTVVRVDR